MIRRMTIRKGRGNSEGQGWDCGFGEVTAVLPWMKEGTTDASIPWMELTLTLLPDLLQFLSGHPELRCRLFLPGRHLGWLCGCFVIWIRD